MPARPCILLILLILGCSPAPEPPTQGQLHQGLGTNADPGFARALEPRDFRFPEDHGAHPDFRNEWWYLTGNLATKTGRRFGYQLTLFRIALTPDASPRESTLAARQVWMGHAAITDISGGEHYASERFARGANGLAGASTKPLRVWLEDWDIRGNDDGFPDRVRFATGEFGLDLNLRPLKPVALQGEQGLSRKNASPGNASYYYSLPRIASSGILRFKNAALTVSGLSWLDREWSTSVLAADQTGWDWFSLQFEDGRDLMFYRLRRQDGSMDPHSAGSINSPDGGFHPLAAKDVLLTPTDWWTGHSGSRYPIGWDLLLRPSGERLRIRTRVPDQEMALTVSYWEGAIEIEDATSGVLLGRGFLELAGY